MSDALHLWMNGEPVARWQLARGAHTLAYDAAWLASPRRRALSLSLPITPGNELRGPAVAHWFDNLLPDNEAIRARLARRFGLGGTEPFALLGAIGRDCVGAVQLLPEDETPAGFDRIDADPLTDTDVAALLAAVPSDGAPALRDDEPFRISIAGAQEKTALLRLDGRWHLPRGATPTTHILKLPLGLVGGSRRVDLSDSVQNEWLCLRLLGALGLPVATTEMARFDGQPVLVVERFDRAFADGGYWIARLPQEDFCQALGQPPARKYEADGGPGMAACLRLLAASDEAPRDRLVFQLAQLAFWLLAATDGHAKNWSVFLGPGDRYWLTPIYDVISMWPYFGDAPNRFRWHQAGLAMALRSKNPHWLLARIEARHWHGLAMKHGGLPVWEAMLGLVDQVEPALAAVEADLPADFPPRTWEAIAAGVRSQVARFRAGVVAPKAL